MQHDATSQTLHQAWSLAIHPQGLSLTGCEFAAYRTQHSSVSSAHPIPTHRVAGPPVSTWKSNQSVSALSPTTSTDRPTDVLCGRRLQTQPTSQSTRRAITVFLGQWTGDVFNPWRVLEKWGGLKITNIGVCAIYSQSTIPADSKGLLFSAVSRKSAFSEKLYLFSLASAFAIWLVLLVFATGSRSKQI